MFRLFPLLLIVVILYNLLVFGFGQGVVGHPEMDDVLAKAISVHMFSGDIWKFSIADSFILASLILLFVEVVKSTRTSSRQIINHGLSMLTFVIGLIEFITLRGFSTSTFFFIVFTTFFDVVAGYTISIVASEHEVGVSHSGGE